MNLQHERIAALCAKLKPGCVNNLSRFFGGGSSDR